MRTAPFAFALAALIRCMIPRELDVLLAPFASCQIVPEGHSVAGLCGVFNLLVDTVLFNRITRWWRIHTLLSSVVFPHVLLSPPPF